MAMEPPRLKFGKAVQGTAMSLAQVRGLWRSWWAGYQRERRRRYELLQDRERRP